MKKTVLTDEESRRLIDLGIPAGEGTFFPHPEGEYWQGDECGDICYTLEDLLAILPKKITYNTFTYAPNIWVDETGAWNVEYVTLNMPFDDMGSSIRADELIDAIYQELCYLRTNNIQEL